MLPWRSQNRGGLNAGAARAINCRLAVTPVLAYIPLIALLAGSLACGGKPFEVKPRPDQPRGTYAAMSESGGVNLQGDAVTDEDYLFDTFDANLIMAGILPVQVKLTNSSGGPLEIHRAKFEVISPAGAHKMVDSRRAFKALMSFYQITTYSKEGYTQSQADFSSHGFDLKPPLPSGESRQGMLFFLVPADVARTPGLTLRVRKLKPKDVQSSGDFELKLD